MEGTVHFIFMTAIPKMLTWGQNKFKAMFMDTLASSKELVFLKNCKFTREGNKLREKSNASILSYTHIRILQIKVVL